MAAILIAAGCGCSGNAAQTDTDQHNSAMTSLSPQQCEAGAQIADASTAEPTSTDSYLIQPGDLLAIEFYLSPEFNEKVVVRPDGNITLRVVGDVRAWGDTPAQLASRLDKAYLTELRDPEVVVHVDKTPSRMVFVEGQVAKPGVFPLQPGMTAVQAVGDAGGVTEEAASKAILIRRDACGQAAGIHFDLNAALKHPENRDDLALLPRDVIVVPRSGIANADLFVKQYIQGLLPVPPYMSFAGPGL